ncbi:DUF4249 domain-containing protein [Pedobacter chinensis]|uniref:DUF4249 domain-containing protein n=1 Tax=Pedobacter chinensis TaxID=2282421 RepID=A0A369PW40_9SPHI|nr:DUF4249 domain-containing protein [Pedobacter chinensis]RDC54906.1 DUF4249 domain-containing protein [Pedobacter chinensis]
MKRLIIYLAILSFCFTACKKIIEIDTNNAEPQIVIEGKITDQFTDQQIIISKSVGYDEKTSYPKITGATVKVSDSRGNNYVFTEKEPGIYTSRMRGISGVTYSLNVSAEGKTFSASSKMPNLVKLDSIGVVINSFFGKERKTAAAYLVDPANETNFYHFNLYVNNLFSRRIYVNNDRLTNGNRLRIQLFYESDDEDDDGLKTGDKISIEMEGIDSNIFDYWYALSQHSGRGPNQGTTPANPPSNISNNALGYFSAHTLQRKSATVK